MRFSCIGAVPSHCVLQYTSAVSRPTYDGRLLMIICVQFSTSACVLNLPLLVLIQESKCNSCSELLVFVPTLTVAALFGPLQANESQHRLITKLIIIGSFCGLDYP